MIQGKKNRLGVSYTMCLIFSVWYKFDEIESVLKHGLIEVVKWFSEYRNLNFISFERDLNMKLFGEWIR